MMLARSEERFRALVENASDLVALVDAEGVCEFQSPSSRATLGYQPDEMVGRRLFDFVHPDDLERSLAAFRELIEGRRDPSFSGELRFRHKDGSWRMLEVKARLFADVAGRASYVFNSRDVTERKQMEDMLRFFRLSVDRAAELIHWMDGEGRILFVNEAMCLRTGYSQDEMLGMTLFDLAPSLSPQLWQEQWSELQRTGSLVAESLHRTKSGETFPVEVLASWVEREGREYSFAYARDVTERVRANAELRMSQTQLEAAMNLADLVNWELDVHTGVFTFNDRFYALYGTTAEAEGGYQMPADVYARKFVHADERHMVAEEIEKARHAVVPDYQAHVEHRIVRPNGEIRNIVVRYAISKDACGDTTRIRGANQDVTERKRTEQALAFAEEQLRQAQKMEAVGQLAGGIAHDFNNLLTAILGCADLVLQQATGLDESSREDVEEIRRAAERASVLTRQILAFSRRQTLRPAVVSLNEVVLGTDRLLRRTLGEHVELVTKQCEDLEVVEVDVSQFEQVLINLALNARDAMSQGGTLTIETANVELGSECASTHPGVKPGPYVLLSVADTGIGMDADTVARAFEPFFTTKEMGQGTGLGLATVYGIVKQSGGSIFLRSEPGQGTVAEIYLPRPGEPDLGDRPAVLSPPKSLHGEEAILVVEDEDSVRRLVTRVLTGLGYRVRAAHSGKQALGLLTASEAPVDLVLTDVILPGGLQGDQLAQEVKALRPDLPVLFMSGYPRDAIVHAGRLDLGVDYLQKPFTPDSLGRYVRGVLDRRAATR
jgi:two-component system, cell cycle sensor histidine kinase and response regulator CckA